MYGDGVFGRPGPAHQPEYQQAQESQTRMPVRHSVTLANFDESF